MPQVKQFKAESKRLMDLMVNSIYTHKEIFLRELISNASDAIDKLYYKSLSEKLSDVNREDLMINIAIDKNERTISISDTGIGMNKAELEANLGTIAKSGSFDFKESMDKNEEIDVIGQFGVGFYSSFMVADKVEVISKPYGEEDAYKWVSENSDGYTISKTKADHFGTTIILHLKAKNKEFDYDQYLDAFKLKALVQKYSDYIRYPIKMDIEEQHYNEETKKSETVIENQTLNSMVPLWKRNKRSIKPEEYNDFYKNKFNDYQDPQKVIHFNVEGSVSFNALLFIPSHAPMDYYTQEYQKGLQLYSSGVFIKDHCEELLPDYFRFVRGLVDSQDLSLNISREMLQHDRQLKVIAQKIEKKIASELKTMLTKNREDYEKFFGVFGSQLKYGIYQDFGANKEKLQDLLLFYSSKEQKLTTLAEYVERMKEDQKDIYFMSGETIEKIDRQPQVELLKDKDYEVLYLNEDIDEFCMQVLNEYAEKHLKNVSQADLDELSSAEDKAKVEEAKEKNKDLLDAIKQGLGDAVSEVRVSSRLKSHAVCLSAAEGMSFEMEKVLANIPQGNPMGMKAARILEINPNHSIFNVLKKVYKDNPDKIKDYAEILLDQALLMEGFEIEDPIGYADKICALMEEANK